MKLAALLLFTLTAFLLAACESAPVATKTAEPRGVPLGDSNVRVSGSLQTGGTISNR
jgi:hypothetical protein